MAEYRRYAEVAVGDMFPPAPLEFVLDAGVIDDFLAATGDDGARYVDTEGPRRVPSMIASVYLISLLRARRSPPGGIHAKQALRFYRALTVGETLTLQARVMDKYVRKGRSYVVADFEALDGGGQRVASGRVTSIWGMDQ